MDLNGTSSICYFNGFTESKSSLYCVFLATSEYTLRNNLVKEKSLDVIAALRYDNRKSMELKVCDVCY